MLGYRQYLCLIFIQVDERKQTKENSTDNSDNHCAILIVISFHQFFLKTTAERAGIYNLSHSL